jgi:cephalosporin hydroxylase
MNIEKTMNPPDEFENQVARNIAQLKDADQLRKQSIDWMVDVSTVGNYTYNFRWLDRPIIQFPSDIVAMQELVWKVKPDIIVETGIAHGGSLMLSASLLAMLDYADAVAERRSLDPFAGRRKVVAVDIDIRAHNRAAIEAHPLAHMVELIQGSSIDPAIVAQVRVAVGEGQKVLVCLDSNHTHEHVLAELQAYAPLASVGSYCVVFDTLVEDVPASASQGRPWGPGNNPKTAVWEYLKAHPEFEIDHDLEAKLLVTVAPDGYLRRRR